MPVTIREVAKHLNLSITTVSRALDGYPDVAKETRERIQRVAQEMGYSPNRAARQLRRQRSDTLGYILPADQPRFNDPFFQEFISGVGDEAAAHNFDLLISTASMSGETEQQSYQRWVHARKVDGFILNRIRLHDWRINYLVAQKQPFVTLERSCDAVDYPSVQVDGKAGFMELVAHLASLSHTSIAYIGGPLDLTIQADRFEGYLAGLKAARLAYKAALVVEGDLTQAGGYLAAQRLFRLPRPPTAIACINDLTAMGVLRAARERGLEVGRQLSVAGFDGIEAAQNVQPPLTTLSQPLYDIARQLAGMLVNLIEEKPLEETQVYLQPNLIVRASTSG